MNDEIIKKLAEHDKRFDEHDKRFDLLIQKVLEHDDRLDRIEKNMATKEDVEKIITTLDEMLGYYKKKDEETILLAHGLKNVEDRVEALENEVGQMKPMLGVA